MFAQETCVSSLSHPPGRAPPCTSPRGVDRRLQALLDKQDGGTPLTADEQAEAEGLVELADLLTLLRLRISETPTLG